MQIADPIMTVWLTSVFLQRGFEILVCAEQPLIVQQLLLHSNGTCECKSPVW